MRGTRLLGVVIAMSSAMVAGCGDDGGSTNPQELITTVILTFTRPGTAPVVAEWNDPDGDGGNPPTIQPVNLPVGDYTLTVGLQNRFETPPEEITVEVVDESDYHLLLFTGTAVVGPASPTPTGPLTHSYGDMDVNGLPIGLTNTIVASAGTGTMTVTLRHMPPEEPPVKAADTPMLAKTGGIASLGGSTDVSVDFMVTVP